MDTYTLHRGHVPLLISLPHDSSLIPDQLAARMVPHARRSVDTDWHVAQLYAPIAEELGASVLTAKLSRYVVDLNRPAGGEPLYPGRQETGLVPTMGFDGQALYAPGQEPDAAEVQQRIESYWRPYHQAIELELDRLLAAHGRAVLWDGHSIRGHVPVLFSGRLPDFNLGTAGGASCNPSLQGSLAECLQRQDVFSHVSNGRFKGGYITRHYGHPGHAIDAVQLELVQETYMDESSFEFLPERAKPVQQLIRQLLQLCVDYARRG